MPLKVGIAGFLVNKNEGHRLIFIFTVSYESDKDWLCFCYSEDAWGPFWDHELMILSWISMVANDVEWKTNFFHFGVVLHDQLPQTCQDETVTKLLSWRNLSCFLCMIRLQWDDTIFSFPNFLFWGRFWKISLFSCKVKKQGHPHSQDLMPGISH